MRRAVSCAIATIFLITFLVMPERFAFVFAPFAPGSAPGVIYTQTSLLSLTLAHLALVGVAVLASGIIAIFLAILVTRPSGAAFMPLARSIAAIGQTFPPVAVLALTVPVMGFGARPTLVALFLYGLLPVFENTLTGFAGQPRTINEAARAMGMRPWQKLIQIDIPICLPMMIAGLRITAVISLGTATIGSTVGTKTLGEVIIAGLLSANTAYILQGGLIIALIAILLFQFFEWLEAGATAYLGLPKTMS